MLNPLLTFVGVNRQGYLADAPLYEALTFILPDPLAIDIFELPDDATNTDDPFDVDAWANALPDGHARGFLVTLHKERARD